MVSAAYYGGPIVISKQPTADIKDDIKAEVDLTAFEEAYQKAYKLVHEQYASRARASIIRAEQALADADTVRDSQDQAVIDEATEKLVAASNAAVNLYWAQTYWSKYNSAFSDENGVWINSIPEAIWVATPEFVGQQYRDHEWNRILKASDAARDLLEQSLSPDYDPSQQEVDAIASELNNSISLWYVDIGWRPVGLAD